MIVLLQEQFIQLWKTLYDMFGDHPDEQGLYHAIATVGTLLLEIGEVGKQFYLKPSASMDSAPSLSVSEITPNDSENPESFPKSDERKEDNNETEPNSQKENLECKPSNQEPEFSDKSTNQEAVSATLDADMHRLHVSDISTPDESLPQVSSDLPKPADSALPVQSEGQTDSGVIDNHSSNMSSSPSYSHKPDSDWSISFEQFIASVLTESSLVNFFDQTFDVSPFIAQMRARRLLRHTSTADPS